MVYRLADEVDCLLFEVGGICLIAFADLLRYSGGRLLGSEHVRPQFGEGVHVEGQVIALVFVARHGGVDEVVELSEGVDILPHLSVRSVEDVGAVLVDVYALHLLGIDVACDIGALVDDEHAFAPFIEFVCADGAVKAAADDEIVVHKFFLKLFFAAEKLALYADGDGAVAHVVDGGVEDF